MASTAMDGADINAMSSSGKGSSKTLANSGSMVMTGTFNNSSGTMYRARDRIDAMESTRVLRNKKDELDYELEQMQKVIAYKEYCLEKMKGKNELPKRKKELQPVDNMSIIYI